MLLKFKLSVLVMIDEKQQFKIELLSLKIKIIFGILSIFLFSLSFGLSILMFYQNLPLLAISSLFIVFSALFVVSILYFIKNSPDNSSSTSIKPFFIGNLLLVLIFGIPFWFLYVANSPTILIIFFIPFLFDFTAFFLVNLMIIPRRFITINKKNDELIYINDFRTKVIRQVINMNDVAHIIFGSKNSRATSGNLANICFILNQNNNNNSTEESVINWNVRTFNIPELCYKLLRIFSNYPVIVEVNSKLILRPIKDFIHKPISPTSADFGFPDIERIKAIFNNSSSYVSTDILPSASNSPKQRFSTLEENINLETEEIQGSKIRSENKIVSILSLILCIVSIPIIIIWLFAMMDLFLHLQIIQTIFHPNSQPRSDQLVAITIYVLTIIFLAPYITLNSLFGQETLVFQNDMLNFSIKAFNKKVFSRKIVTKAIIGVECSNKKISLRLLGGDVITYWKGRNEDMVQQLRTLANYLY